MNDLNVIDRFMQAFIRYIDSGFGLLGPDVGFLTTTLIGIDVTLAGLFWAMGGEDNVIGRFIRKILYVGTFAFILNRFSSLADIIFRLFAAAGLTAGGGTMSADDLLKPGRLAGTGFSVRRASRRWRAVPPSVPRARLAGLRSVRSAPVRRWGRRHRHPISLASRLPDRLASVQVSAASRKPRVTPSARRHGAHSACPKRRNPVVTPHGPRSTAACHLRQPAAPMAVHRNGRSRCAASRIPATTGRSRCRR